MIFFVFIAGTGVFGTQKIVKWKCPPNDICVFQRWQWAFRHAGKSLSGIVKILVLFFHHWQWGFCILCRPRRPRRPEQHTWKSLIRDCQ